MVDRRLTSPEFQLSQERRREGNGVSLGTIDALAAQLCVLGGDGVILDTNRAWDDFGADDPLVPERAGVGANYLAVCDAASGPQANDAAAFAAGVRGVIRGERDSFALEYPCPSTTAERWFLARVTREPGGGPVRVVVVHENITERKFAERKIREQLDELLRWQGVTLGRENRVRELKAEVNALLAAQGQPARYPSQSQT